MQRIQVAALSIAGFDPCGGAGVLADVKTFEQTGCYGLAVNTCLTWQNDIKFDGLQWINEEVIERQFMPLASRFTIPAAKIGLVRDAGMLRFIVKMLKTYDPNIKIVWDPVLKSSTGFDFHNEALNDEIDAIAAVLCLVTPNTMEADKLDAKSLSAKTNVLLKGGHQTGNMAKDILFTEGREITLAADRTEGAEKHGSGCVLSAAITSFLVQGYDLETSCRMAKDYTLKYLLSATGLLGFHHTININEYAG